MTTTEKNKPKGMWSIIYDLALGFGYAYLISQLIKIGTKFMDADKQKSGGPLSGGDPNLENSMMTTDLASGGSGGLTLPTEIDPAKRHQFMRPQILDGQSFNYKVWRSFQGHWAFFNLLDDQNNDKRAEYIDPNPIWEESLLRYINDDSQKR